MPSLLVLNINLPGRREPHHYGGATLADIQAQCHRSGATLGFEADFRRNDHEGALIDVVHEPGPAAIVINAGGYRHTFVALRDAPAAVVPPTVEVHPTNIHRREPYRHTPFVSEVSEVTDVVICGAVAHGYVLAPTHLAHPPKRENRWPRT